MREKDFFGVVSAIAQFIEKADSSGEGCHAGAGLATPVEHKLSTACPASPALTENHIVKGG